MERKIFVTEAKLTLLRRHVEGRMIEPVDIAVERMATDDEIKALYRNPKRWSYVVRRPDGSVGPWGEDDTQQACLDIAVEHVARSSAEAFTFDENRHETWGRGDRKWDFLLWPPDE
jgi:hypothetical protein